MKDLKTLQRFHGFLKPHLALFLGVILFNLIAACFLISIPLFVKVALDRALAYQDIQLLNTSIATITAAYILYYCFSIISDYCKIYTNEEMVSSLTERVFERIQRLPLKFHLENKPETLLTRTTKDVSGSVQMIEAFLPTILVNGGKIFIIIAILTFIDFRFAVLAVATVLIYIWEIKSDSKIISKFANEAVLANSDIISRASERLTNIKTIKAFGQERNESLSFAWLIKRRYRTEIKKQFLETIKTFGNSATLKLWSIFLIWYLGIQAIKSELTIGEAVMLLLFVHQLASPVKSLTNLVSKWKANLESMVHLYEIFDAPCEENSGTSTDRIHFSPLPSLEILNDVSVKFPPQKITAVVNNFADEKTNLANILFRFIDPTSETILIDDHKITDIHICELRNKLGLVTRESSLFDGTVMDNILYGSENKERGDAMSAARLVGAHNFIEKLPGGYDARVGHCGELLSRGEQKLIAIARVILRNPPIIIFDESDEPLDTKCELSIYKTLSSLKNTKTVIVMAQRLSTMKLSDNILVLENGKFVEEGRFENLMEKRGIFYNFYWKQFGGLSNFRKQLELEIERSARYGSKFSAVILKVKDIEMETVDLSLKKMMRLGDNSVVFEGDSILILLPEIDEGQLKKYFKRITNELPKMLKTIDANNLLFTGFTVTKKSFDSSESLISALKSKIEKEDELFSR